MSQAKAKDNKDAQVQALTDKLFETAQQIQALRGSIETCKREIKKFAVTLREAEPWPSETPTYKTVGRM